MSPFCTVRFQTSTLISIDLENTINLLRQLIQRQKCFAFDISLIYLAKFVFNTIMVDIEHFVVDKLLADVKHF